MSLTPEQLEARKSGLGGSDVAAIMGMSPWKTAHTLYLEKRGEIEDEFLDSEVIHFGNVLEDVVAGEYARRNEVKVERRNDMFKHKKYPFMLANIDRKVVGVRKGLECKTADKFTRGKWGASGTDEVPDYYHIQTAHYMNVLGYDEYDLAVLIGGNEYREYPLTRDPELSEMLIEGCVKFWERVEKGIPPEIDFEHQTAIDAIKRMYPGTNGETIDLPKELEHWHYVAVGQFPDIAFQYKRSQVKKKEYIVKATSYYQMRGSAIRSK
jgi:putative phage-type endonuclease